MASSYGRCFWSVRSPWGVATDCKHQQATQQVKAHSANYLIHKLINIKTEELQKQQKRPAGREAMKH